jgi:hypothetical protein
MISERSLLFIINLTADARRLTQNYLLFDRIYRILMIIIILKIMLILSENSFNEVENNKTPPLCQRNGVFKSIACPLFKRLKEIFQFYGQFTPMNLFVKGQDRDETAGGNKLKAEC